MGPDIIASVSSRLEFIVVALLTLYGVSVPMIAAVGFVFWQRARGDVAANQLTRW